MRMLWTVAAALFFCAGPAHAERWLKIDPADPYSKHGSFHWFDVDSAYEDSATGWVYAWAGFADDEAMANGAPADKFLWAFDCERNAVHYAAWVQNGEFKKSDDWREKSTDLSTPTMGGVTNLFGRRLCALKGALPKRPIF